MQITINIADEQLDLAAKGAGYKAQIPNTNKEVGGMIDNPMSKAEFLKFRLVNIVKQSMQQGGAMNARELADSSVS